MQVMGGVDATRSLRDTLPGIKVLVLTGWADTRALREVAHAGAAGCVLKGGDGADLVNAIRTVAAGKTVWPESSAMS
jgi:DNA-binding NarL/FixJ family response regulator